MKKYPDRKRGEVNEYKVGDKVGDLVILCYDSAKWLSYCFFFFFFFLFI